MALGGSFALIGVDPTLLSPAAISQSENISGEVSGLWRYPTRFLVQFCLVESAVSGPLPPVSGNKCLATGHAGTGFSPDGGSWGDCWVYP
jgi:hypothetical protein